MAGRSVPIKPAAGNAGWGFCFQPERHRPGMPEPDRSAGFKVSAVCVLVIVFALATIGCSREHGTSGKGDAGQFILQHTSRYGGVPTTTNGLPVVTSRWRYVEDAYGMQIQLPADDYARVEAFLDRAFAGARQFDPGTSTGSRPRIHAYRMSAKGGGIQLTEQDSHTLVIILRPSGGSQ
jgi:hypothetical protein